MIKLRHAILIMAHGNMSVVEKTLSIMDSENIDFYIHIDAKEKGDYSYLKNQCKYSMVYLTKRIKVFWADYSMIEAEYILLETAIKGKYDYYHLISGADLPLKTPDGFKAFFENTENKGKEFIKPVTTSEEFEKNKLRVIMYYPFVKMIKRGNSMLWNQIQKALFSRILRFPKSKELNIVKQLGWNIYLGENWFNITFEFANYLIKQKKGIIEKYFTHSYTADEVFALTILKNSVFADKLGKVKTRLTDWKRGKPYVWHLEDKDQLLSTECLFARKFDTAKDAGIVDEIYAELVKRKQRQNP